MTTTRTHGPCTCRTGVEGAHHPDCPSIYPAQQEPDAITRLVRHLRTHSEGDDEFTDIALSLISEAREEHKKALADARNGAIDKVLDLLAKRSAMYSDAAKEMPMRAHLNDAKGAEDDMLASVIRRMKDTEP